MINIYEIINTWKDVVNSYGNTFIIDDEFLASNKVKKLNNAIFAYASNLNKDEGILIIYDDTLFGSAKEGFIVTAVGIYSKASFEKPKFITWDEIKSITVEDKIITYQTTNNKENLDRYKLVLADKDETEMLSNFLQYTFEAYNNITDIEEVYQDNGNYINIDIKECKNCGAPLSTMKEINTTSGYKLKCPFCESIY